MQQKTFNFFYVFILAILGVGATLMAEDITLTTYYPAPYGAYDELTTTGNTYLATTSGNVGIGTTVPTALLNVNGNIKSNNITGNWIGFSGNNSLNFDSSSGTFLNSSGNSVINIDSDNNATTNSFRIATNTNTSSGGTELLRVQENGSVGIGTTDPQATLDVAGNIKATLSTVPGAANMRYNNGTREVGWNDVAELFDTNEEVEVNDLLVIDEASDIRLKKSHIPYDTKVAGIVSGSPAILFQGSQLEIAPAPGGFAKGTKPPVAISGRVLCKVSIENGAILRGDLLTSSSTSGHAMKATDQKKSFGAIVGKALESFQGGPNGETTGKIMVLVTLQ